MNYDLYGVLHQVVTLHACFMRIFYQFDYGIALELQKSFQGYQDNYARNEPKELYYSTRFQRRHQQKPSLSMIFF